MTLDSHISELPGVGVELSRKLKKLGVETLYDLLNHIPSRYIDYSKISNFNDLKINEPVTVEGQIISLRNIYTKTGKIMQEGEVSNGENILTVVWFNQTYLLRTLKVGSNVALTGKVSFWGKKKALFAPQYEIIKDKIDRLHSGKIVAIYPETKGITSKWLRRLVHQGLKHVQIEDHLSSEVRSQKKLESLRTSFELIHSPQKESDPEQARTRLAFDELLLHAYSQLERKSAWHRLTVSKKFEINKKHIEDFKNALPFSLTESQVRSIQEITSDLGSDTPMNRLLEGDVGSGKTAVAAYASYISYLNNSSSVIMAPTQILAQQHYKTLTALLKDFNIPVQLVTSKHKVTDLKKPSIYVGTHALLFKLISSHVGLVVIDEQHRFGVKQRAAIANLGLKNTTTPHTLTMTATPIPRTIALTLYGDLDLSTLKELPRGRKKIKTWVVPQAKRKSAYSWIEKEINEQDTQAFVVCPLIEESESETMKEVKVAKTEYERLKKIFKGLNVALLHGKMKVDEKDKILSDFRAKKFDILVTTPVVEVGIDIPNATIMMIESSDRFGLAALHQLRGRVGRGEKQSYCLLFTDSKSEKVLQKLNAMSNTLSGKELAELDLQMRGPGEIFGTRQSGLPELKIARWSDVDLIKNAKAFAEEVFNDSNKYEAILQYFKKRQKAPN